MAELSVDTPQERGLNQKQDVKKLDRRGRWAFPPAGRRVWKSAGRRVWKSAKALTVQTSPRCRQPCILEPTKRPVVQTNEMSVHHFFKVKLPRLAKQLAEGSHFLQTVRCLVNSALELQGGAGFACASSSSYQRLEELKVLFTVTDYTKQFVRGYMTHKLQNHHISHIEHQNFLRAQSKHTTNDRWPEGHEAQGLPKDGYNLYDSSGLCCLAAARLEGLPAAPCEWTNVGMRHTTALQLCWMLALQGHTAVVLVRSDSGSLHILCACDGAVEVLAIKR